MQSSVKLTLWVLSGASAVHTVFFNLFIVLLSLQSCRTRGRSSPSESIMVALSTASLLYQMLSYVWMTMDELDTTCQLSRTTYTLMLLLIYCLKFTILWDSGFLTFYYSTKLVTTPNACYTHIQASILRHVIPAVLLIPLCGLCTVMPMMAVFHAENATSYNQDCGVLVPSTKSGKLYEVAYILLADVLPGLLMAKCCISISLHLALHLRHMKASTNGAHAPRLGSQMRVIQMALSLVAVFAMYLVVDLYVQYQITVNHENVITLAFFFTSGYTTLAAMVLIYGKKTFWKALIRDYNTCMDEFPCLSCLKVPEHKAKPSAPAKIKT